MGTVEEHQQQGAFFLHSMKPCCALFCFLLQGNHEVKSPCISSSDSTADQLRTEGAGSALLFKGPGHENAGCVGSSQVTLPD